jgi:hypothetical protein
MKDEEGFNAQTERYEDLVAAGVIDPTKVVRAALQNAASITSLLLTTEAVITLTPERHQNTATSIGGMATVRMGNASENRSREGGVQTRLRVEEMIAKQRP